MSNLSHLITTAHRREQDGQETLQRVVELLQTRNHEVERLEQELADLRRRLTSKEDHVEALCRYCRVHFDLAWGDGSGKEGT